MQWSRGILVTLVIVVALFWQQGYFHIPAAQADDETLPAEPGTLFADVSRAAGIVQTRQGDERAIGQAWGDYDGDGRLDLYVTDPEGPNTLFHNNGDGTFSRSPLTGQVSLPDAYSGGATFVDYDNDGRSDLYVVNWGANTLFRNEGGHFVDVTDVAGVGDPANGQSASWGDFDNDGYLDLYVANWACYPRCGRPSTGDSDRLYRNNGDGTFSDVTHWLNSKVLGSGFIASFVDYDNDGDLDIYLINDEFIHPIGNALWRNDGPGCKGWCFTEVSAQVNADTKVMGMGLAVLDYDNDGRFDFYFSNAGPMTLLRNQEDGTFVNVAPSAGVDLPTGIGWGAVAFDYDNDGWQDLYLAVMTTTDGKGIPANPLWRNKGDGTFARIHSGSGAGAVGPSMGAATADYDQDGWVDLVVGDAMFGYTLLRNQGAAHFPDHNWLTLQLVGGGPVNRDAVGTRVEVRTADGRFQTQEVRNGVALGGGSELALHFGLGNAAGVDVTVIWPNGRTQQFANVPANQRVILPYPLDTEAEATQRTALYSQTSPPASSAAAAGAIPWPIILAVGAAAILATLIFTRRPLPRPSLRPSRAWVTVTLLLAAFGVMVVLVENGRQPTNQPTSLPPLLAELGVTLPQRVPPPSAAQILLGEALYWEPLLSGNKDTSCATCHHSLFATGDELSVSIGTGGKGLGLARIMGERRELIPRNAPTILNLGLVGMDVMFWDGRAHGTATTGFVSPADDDLPFNLENAVAVQAMFPITSRDEMRGKRGDLDIFGERNELAQIPDHDFEGMWDGVMARLLAISEYVELFAAAYPDTPTEELSFAHAANALAAYQMETFTFLDSPWDRYLAGETDTLTPEVEAGARLFYGAAGCAQCHSGPLLSDLQFHNLAVPQIGPGKGNEQPLDFGRARETGDQSDLYAFRTPPLRNVALTGPWMHNGAFTSLETAVRHHFNPLPTYDAAQLTLLMQETVPNPDTCHIAAAAPSITAPTPYLSDAEVAAILAFLEALTSETAVDLRHTIPARVPSGLPVEGG